MQPSALTAADRREAWIFFAIAFVVLAAGYGLRDPWPADEPRFVLVAQQMLESGNFLFPHRGNELYPDKPPLYFWLLALARSVIGSWRWSFLLPSLLSALGTLALTYDLGRRLWNPRAGLWAAIAVMASFQFVYQAKRAQIDPTLVFFTTLAFYGIARHCLLGPAWRWFWGGCVAAGLGVISKGVGFLPLFALLPFALMTRLRWQGLATTGPGQAVRWAGGLPAFLLPIALWLVPLLVIGLGSGLPEHAAYLQNLLFKQTATRYVDPWHHDAPAWYFVQVVLLYWLPFTLALPWLVGPWARDWRARDARTWLPLGWALLVIAFFSLSPGKRDMYILPALPALALAASPHLDAIAGRVGFRRLAWGFLVLLSGTLLAAGCLALLSDPAFETRAVRDRGLGDEARWLWAMLATVGAVGLAGALAWRIRGALRGVALLLASLWIGYGLVLHPVLDGESSAREVMQQARALAGPGTTLGLMRWKEQYLLQATGPVFAMELLAPPDRQAARAVTWLRADPGARRLLVRREKALACADFVPGAEAIRVGIANRREIWLLGAGAVQACPGMPPPVPIPSGEQAPGPE